MALSLQSRRSQYRRWLAQQRTRYGVRDNITDDEVIRAIRTVPTHYALSLLHFAQHYTNGSTTPAVTLSASTTAGSLLAVGIAARRGAGIPTVSSVTDSASNTYSQVSGARATMSANNAFTDIWCFPNVGAGVTSVTATLSATPGDSWVAVWEIAGAATSTPVDVGGQASDQTTSVGASVTTSNAADFLVGLETGPVTFTGIHAGNVFTANDKDNANGIVLTCAWDYYIASATGTFNPQWDGDANNCSSTAAFKAAAGGTAGAPYFYRHLAGGGSF